MLVDHSEEQCVLRYFLSDGGKAGLSDEALDILDDCCLVSLRASARGCLSSDSDPERILKELEKTEFRPLVKRLAKGPGPIDFSDLEIEMDSYLMQQSRKLIRQFPMSVDVILGFMFLKDLEVKNLNRIVKAKQLGLPETFIEKAIAI